MPNSTSIQTFALNARQASLALRSFTHIQRKSFLTQLAIELKNNQKVILAANQKDIAQAKKKQLSLAIIDRLTLTESRLKTIAQSVQEIKILPDPLNNILEQKKSTEGLNIKRVSKSIGTILFIFESRPNVMIDGASLCFKSGNAVILKGGKECLHTNEAFFKCIYKSLKKHKLPIHAVQFITTSNRDQIKKLLQSSENLDLVIPRGGEKLIQFVVEHSKIPVIKHYKGICHIFIDSSADFKKASRIILNAKVQRPGVCNAMETLLIHEKWGTKNIKQLLEQLLQKSVTLLGCPKTCQYHPQVKAAKMVDWDTEYLDLILSIKVVKNTTEAITHIQKHGTGHTEAIISKTPSSLQAFTNQLDSSSIMLNASTRFSDGSVYGLGAEVGISTDRIHARGPMGIESLTTYQWIITGKGQIRQ